MEEKLEAVLKRCNDLFSKHKVLSQTLATQFSGGGGDSSTDQKSGSDRSEEEKLTERTGRLSKDLHQLDVYRPLYDLTLTVTQLMPFLLKSSHKKQKNDFHKVIRNTGALMCVAGQPVLALRCFSMAYQLCTLDDAAVLLMVSVCRQLRMWSYILDLCVLVRPFTNPNTRCLFILYQAQANYYLHPDGKEHVEYERNLCKYLLDYLSVTELSFDVCRSQALCLDILHDLLQQRKPEQSAFSSCTSDSYVGVLLSCRALRSKLLRSQMADVFSVKDKELMVPSLHTSTQYNNIGVLFAYDVQCCMQTSINLSLCLHHSSLTTDCLKVIRDTFALAHNLTAWPSMCLLACVQLSVNKRLANQRAVEYSTDLAKALCAQSCAHLLMHKDKDTTHPVFEEPKAQDGCSAPDIDTKQETNAIRKRATRSRGAQSSEEAIEDTRRCTRQNTAKTALKSDAPNNKAQMKTKARPPAASSSLTDMFSSSNSCSASSTSSESVQDALQTICNQQLVCDCVICQEHGSSTCAWFSCTLLLAQLKLVTVEELQADWSKLRLSVQSQLSTYLGHVQSTVAQHTLPLMHFDMLMLVMSTDEHSLQQLHIIQFVQSCWDQAHACDKAMLLPYHLCTTVYEQMQVLHDTNVLKVFDAAQTPTNVDPVCVSLTDQFNQISIQESDSTDSQTNSSNLKPRSARTNSKKKTAPKKPVVKSNSKERLLVSKAKEVLMQDWIAYKHLLYWPWTSLVCDVLLLLTYYDTRYTQGQSENAWTCAWLMAECNALGTRAQTRDLAIHRKLAKLNVDEPREPLPVWDSAQQFKEAVTRLPQDWACVQLHVSAEYSAHTLWLCRMNGVHCPLIIPVTALHTTFTQTVKQMGCFYETNDRTSKLTDRTQFWNNRYSLDEQIKRVCARVQAEWLYECVYMLCHSTPTNQRTAQALVHAHVPYQLAQVMLLCSERAQADRILSRVRCVDLDNAAIATALHDHYNPGYASAFGFGFKTALTAPAEPQPLPVFLVLPACLRCISWESVPVLYERMQPLARWCCVHLAVRCVNHLLPNTLTDKTCNNTDMVSSDRNELPALAPSNTFYVLDPDANLQPTNDVFQPICKAQRGWDGLSQQRPSYDQLMHALGKNDVFLFCGHGGLVNSVRVRLTECRASAVLSGCASVCTKPSGLYQAQCRADDYAVALSPCLVGTLWSVTDQEIDRFMLYVLQSWLLCLDEKNTQLLQNARKLVKLTDKQSEVVPRVCSLLQAMARARRHAGCKLPYLTAASCVAYGLPVTVQL